MTETTAALLPTGVIGLVLLAAILHATWNALVKIGGDRLIVLASVNAVAAIAGLLMIPLAAAPNPESWPYLALSVAFHSAYYFFLLKAYESGDFSHVYPLARGSAPLMVLLGSAWFAGEYLPPIAIAGIGIASIGIASLAFDGGPPWRRDPRPLLFAVATGVSIASYTVVDGVGVRHSDSPFGYIGWLFAIDGLPITLVALHLRRRLIRSYLHNEWRHCIGAGIASIGAYGLVIYAMNSGAIAAVSALRETSVIIAAAIGTFALGERFGRRRIILATIVTTGILLMHSAL
ncbi:MAG: DMT family transporter [Gammaproteobacteria bacterium]|nr:DMT family transporter [Gammaproteobacteria bacterium]